MARASELYDLGTGLSWYANQPYWGGMAACGLIGHFRSHCYDLVKLAVNANAPSESARANQSGALVGRPVRRVRDAGPRANSGVVCEQIAAIRGDLEDLPCKPAGAHAEKNPNCKKQTCFILWLSTKHSGCGICSIER